MKTSLIVFFLKKEERVQLSFIIRNNIVAKKTTELVFLFHKKTTKLVFIWPNMSQKSIKVLTGAAS